VSATKEHSSKALKGRNLSWLVAVLVFDVLLILALAFHAALQDIASSKLMLLRSTLSVLLPIPALILSSLIPADQKAILIFWRLKHALPGARAFTQHAQTDPRIDVVGLRKNVGEFPSDERAQNAKWYGLYKLVAGEPSVIESHKNYLLFRDIASMSLLLVPAVPLAMWIWQAGATQVQISAVLFLAQYLLSALAARTTGIRFVQTVMAIHSVQKVPGAKPPARRSAPKSQDE
jgi:hypothetical protein